MWVGQKLKEDNAEIYTLRVWTDTSSRADAHRLASTSKWKTCWRVCNNLGSSRRSPRSSPRRRGSVCVGSVQRVLTGRGEGNVLRKWSSHTPSLHQESFKTPTRKVWEERRRSPRRHHHHHHRRVVVIVGLGHPPVLPTYMSHVSLKSNSKYSGAASQLSQRCSHRMTGSSCVGQ